MAKQTSNINTCKCPNPPGGIVKCESHQLAICRLRDGMIEAECITLPKNLSTIAMKNWTLCQITGAKRSLNERITLNEQRILDQGEYLNLATGENIKFRLPTQL